MRDIITHLVFPTEAREAVEFYTSLVPGARVLDVVSYEMPSADFEPLTIRFEMAGRVFYAINGGSSFRFEQGASLYVQCDTQEEIDLLWDGLSAGGRTEMCGWLTDRYGLSWQIVPSLVDDTIYGPDPAAAERVVQAVLRSQKLDLDVIEAAIAGHEG